MSAKACRHLASIARSSGGLEECRVFLDKADSYAEQIGDESKKQEMLDSLVLSRAKAIAASGDHSNAVRLLEEARARLQAAGDALREVKVFYPLGMARLALGDRDGAVEAFTEGHRFAVRCGRKDEALANASELAKAFANTNELEKAQAWATTAVKLANDLSDYPIARSVVALAGQSTRQS
jgi:hypothetical protein